jgi:hypothetical protein
MDEIFGIVIKQMEENKMTDEKICQSCGMPMRNAEDFGGGRTDNLYCAYCSDEAGELKPYEQVLAGMSAFARQMMGISEEEALKFAKEGMAKMPAWQNAGK